MEERVRCSVCGVNLTDDTVNHFDGEIYCDRCFEEITIHNGDILNLRPDGNIVYSKFDYDEYRGYGFRDWWDYGMYYSSTNSYIDDLKSVAVFEGISPEEIDMLVDSGFTPDEIEEYIYCM